MTPALSVHDLTFRYRSDQPAVLAVDRFTVEPGERCVLVGANGAGKTTLLRVLAGRYLVPPDAVRVLDRPAFHDTSLVREVAFVGGRFAFDVDLPVRQVIDNGPPVNPALRARLTDLLDVDPGWSMRFVSDGQRRRVQILLALLRRPRVLLLDEVTTDLDVLARQDLLAHLRRETEERGATILYATHILDALDDWTTHLAWLSRGRLVRKAPLDSLDDYRAWRAGGSPSPLLRMVERWLRDERAGTPT